jgi:hypothetical protein
MNSTIKRYSAADVPESGRPGFWVHAGDFNQVLELAANREAALQQRLNIADRRVCDLEHARGQCLEVNPTSLRALLIAVTGAPHEIREIQACRGIPDNPIDQLLREYNDWVYAPAPPAAKLDASMIGIVHTPPMEYDEP